MRPWNLSLVRALILSSLMLLIALGCSEDSTKPPDTPTGYADATTITQLLRNFMLSYREMDLNEYEKLLDENFVFVFDPGDVGPEEPWQNDTWSGFEDLISAENMFEGQPNIDGRAVDAIELEFVAGQPETSPVNDEWQMVVLNAVDLHLHTTDVNSGDQWLLQTPGNYFANLHLVQRELDGGRQVWKIIRWEDVPPSYALVSVGTETTTWGSIKANYYQQAP